MKIRVLPLVMTGAGLLLVLKAAGLVTGGHYAFEAETVQPPHRVVEATYRPLAVSRAPGTSYYDPIVTGSLPPKKEEPETAAEPAADAEQAGEAVTEAPAEVKPVEPPPPADMSASERALLDRLQSRRQELDGRAQELDLRESLLRAAEQKLEGELATLKSTEERISAVQAAKKAEEDARLKDLVTMYENMKPKQAAAIFDGLDLKVLVDLTTQMNPKKSGEIIAKMTPDMAQRLTVALARKQMENAAASAPAAATELPKIESRAPGQ